MNAKIHKLLYEWGVQPHKRINFNRSLEALGFVCMKNEDKYVYIGVKKIF